jgi:hypothetical protein
VSFWAHAFRDGMARKSARRAVPGPLAKHDAHRGTTPRHVGPCLAWARGVPARAALLIFI